MLMVVKCLNLIDKDNNCIEIIDDKRTVRIPFVNFNIIRKNEKSIIGIIAFALFFILCGCACKEYEIDFLLV